MTNISHDIQQAAQLLRDGKLVAFATETVYGLGADATNDRAVARIFEAKERPEFNPLIVHVASKEAAFELGVFNDNAVKLADAFWPGPLTLVVPRAEGCPVSLLASAGLETVAIRVPAHSQAQELLRLADIPVAAPSANPSGRISPTTSAHVMAGLAGHIDMVLEGGDCGIGMESTIVGCVNAQPALLRPGGIGREDIEALLGCPLPIDDPNCAAPSAPGQLLTHYAPRAAVRINAAHAEPDEALLAFGADAPGHDGIVLNLSATGDLGEAAANLFAFLHQLDALGCNKIAVMPVPETGLGSAINDRLRRASYCR